MQVLCHPKSKKGGPKTALSKLNRMAQMQDPKVLHHVHAARSARLTR
jgi:hypothetical protein